MKEEALTTTALLSSEDGNYEVVRENKANDEALFNVHVMGAGFLVLFAAYNTVQATDSTVLDDYTGDFTGITYDLGTVSLCILYATVCPSLLFAPMVIHRLGEGPTMVIGALLYTVYMVSLVHVYEIVVWVSSILVGFGAAILWVAQGVLIT
eukprot:CAMPEP_0185781558 /NCGR_PEP_ID=MMETSP1174-20130828/102857_1 /TAXON_ID=35687 /ORGANISM="Dictyocha speculum, Strain CCMP1381" /LENGTH=151 /DNA_ID=CAMNT_0028471583 /DNA_START=199 /DNA_END=650 /DNA_ORIENTATION=+